MIKKNYLLNIIAIIILILFVNNYVIAETPPMPGLPHSFWGTVKDSNGNFVPDGSIVKAIVDGQNKTTTVVNGTYGYYTPFRIEDPNNENIGKTIYFYVNDVRADQTAIFNPGTTQLNLTVNLNNQNGNNNPPSSDGNGAGASSSDLIPPHAEISAPFYGFVNKTVSFNATKSYDIDGEIVSYSWNLGDGSFGSGEIINHTYNRSGEYTVTLKVTDDDNLYSTDEITITITVDSDDDDWGDEEEREYGTDPDNASDYPLDTDQDHIPDVNDSDDDNDGIEDLIEEVLGSDPKKKDVLKIEINNQSCFLVYLDEDDIPDLFYNPLNEKARMKKQSDTEYLLDINGDGAWDYVYNSQTGFVSGYKEKENFYLYIALLVLLLLMVIILILFKKGGKRRIRFNGDEEGDKK